MSNCKIHVNFSLKGNVFINLNSKLSISEVKADSFSWSCFGLSYGYSHSLCVSSLLAINIRCQETGRNRSEGRYLQLRRGRCMYISVMG